MRMRAGVLPLLLLWLAACGDGGEVDDAGAVDEPPAGLTSFSREELGLLHGESSKAWRVVQVYREYPELVDRVLGPCATDDRYVFHADSELVDVALGDVACHYLLGPQATEDAGGELTYVTSSKHLILFHWRAEEDEPAQRGASDGWYAGLDELTATRALFVAGTPDDWGRGLELEAVERGSDK
jgi:hypothetical protein